MSIPNAAYWRARDTEWQKHYDEWSDIAAGQLQAALHEAQQRLELALRRFDDEVRANARGQKVTYADFNAQLSADELYIHQQAFAALGGDAPNIGPFRGMQWDKYQQWVPIVRSHLEAMGAQIDAWTAKLAADYQKVLQDAFEQMAEMRDAFNWESLDKAVGYHLDFDRISPHQIAALAELGSGLTNGDFSAAVWANRDNLASALRRILPQRFLTGTPLPKMVKELQKMTDGSRYAAERILRTEGTAISARADELMYAQLDLEQYKFLATLDLRTDDICIAMDGLIFNVKDMVIGTNAQPLHPNCRCTTVPYIEPDEFSELGERAARDENGKTIMVPDTMTYQEWKDKFYPEAGNTDTSQTNAASEQTSSIPKNELIDFQPSQYTIEECNRDIRAELTQDERDAIFDYSTSKYSKINGYLRDGATYWDGFGMEALSEWDKTYCKNAVEQLDSAFTKLTIPHDMTLWRVSRAEFMEPLGIRDLAELQALDPKDIVGREIGIKSYTSTTHEQAFAAQSHGDILFEIRTPKGTPGYYIKSIAQLKSEEETLLGRGLVARIADVQQGSFAIIDGAVLSTKVIIEISREQPGLPALP